LLCFFFSSRSRHTRFSRDWSSDVCSSDLLQAYDQASGVVIENVYEGLFGYARDSAQELVPVLATAYEVSDDGLTYTFHLREGVRSEERRVGKQYIAQ